MLIVNKLTKSYGVRTLFSDLSFTLNPRDRLGVVGANGSGKTTLCEILSGNIEADSGEIHLVRGASLGYLEQNMTFSPDGTLLSELVNNVSSANDLDHKRNLIHDLLSTCEDPAEQESLLHELGEIEEHFLHLGGYSIEHEAKKILTGLGFCESDFDRSMSEFSGGWVMRAGLARLLLSEPDILFLDEPTNHLDLDALLWFEAFLRDYSGAVILISHDRAFLNRTVTRVIAFENGKAKLYTGSYDSYIEARDKEREILEATVKNQERFIETEMRFINRFRAKNTKASQVQSRMKRLEKMDVVTLDARGKTMRLAIPKSPRSGKTVLSMRELEFAYDGNPVYENLDITLVRGEKIAFVGPNGAGKSTLLKLLAGELAPGGGVLELGHNVNSVYYAQHQTEQLADANTVIGEMRLSAGMETDERLRTMLGAFLFTGDDVDKKVSMLSGGEKARLALAKMFIRPSNLILMDEPTNHLDIPSRDVLADALLAYDGTLCLITHDRDLIDHVANRVFDIRNGVVSEYHGNYSYYLAKRESEQVRQASWEDVSKSGDPKQEKRGQDKERKRAEASMRNRIHRETKKQRARIQKIEKETESVSARITEVEDILADPARCGGREEIGELSSEYTSLVAKKNALEEEWMEIEMEVEEIRDSIMAEIC